MPGRPGSFGTASTWTEVVSEAAKKTVQWVGGWLAKAAWEVIGVFVGYKMDAGDRGLEVLEFEPTRPPAVVAGDVGLESE